jgi:iron complex outermembrane receptor protein
MLSVNEREPSQALGSGMKKQAWGLSASVLALVVGYGGLARAQSLASGGDTPDQRAPRVEEVVVTAERRATNLQETPIAASVLTGGDMARKGVITIDQLQFAVPSVAVDNFGQGLEFNIRGIGKAEHNSQTTTGVITYRDGVATFPGYFQEEPYYDIASIEILRGPQGTFVGQNATGGAVFVTTQDPIINGGYHGYVAGQVGNYEDAAVQAAVNLPIDDALAARISFNGERRDSFYHITGPWTGDPGNLKEGSIRLGVLWEPTPALKVLFKTDYDYLDLGSYPADPATDTNNPFQISSNAHLYAVDQFVRSIVNAEYTLSDGIKVRSISGFQTGRTGYDGDLDGTSASNFYFFDGVDETIYSQELNIISPDRGPFTWILGAYYQHDTYDFPPGHFYIGLPVGVAEYTLYGSNPEHTVAGFGQAALKLTNSFQMQAGLRYTTATTTNHSSIDQFGTVLSDEQTLTSNAVTGKVALNWRASRENFFYAFVATGFKAGGLNVPVGLGQPAAFGPEKVTEFEGGWKSTLFSGRLKTQIDGYYNNYKNFQVIVGYPDIPTFGFELNDPSKTKIYGFEASTQANFGALSVDASLGVLHSSLGGFYAVDPRIAAFGACSPQTGPTTASCIDLAGRPQPYAPNLTYSAGGQYTFKLSHGDTLTPRLNFGHVSGQWATLFDNEALGDRLGPRNILGAQVAWSHGDLVATLYGTNLTDQHYIGAVQSGLRFAAPPRQYGFRLMKLF